MENTPKAAIFDLDGTLVDSEAYWPEVEDAVWGKLGIEVDGELGRQLVGTSIEDAVRLVNERRQTSLRASELRPLVHAFAISMYQERTQLMPGALELIGRFQERGIPLAIATSSPRSWIEAVLEKFNLGDAFQCLVSVDSLGLPGKPHPAVFSEAIKLLNVSPPEAVAFEDTERGIRSAKASGAYTIAVLDPRWSVGEFSQADLLADSLRDSRIQEALRL